MIELRSHEAVMVQEVIKNLLINNQGNYVDCTFGMGGHTSAILDSLGSQGHLTSIDKDSYSEEIAIKLSLEDKRMRFISGSFGNLEDYFEKNSLDGVLLDLGISSNQLDDPDRGFSFKNSGPLDMRMDQTSSLSAEFWINNASKEEIEKVFKEIAEERQSRKITRLICSKRVESPIKTTKDLVNIVLSSRSGTSKIHTLRNIFRAIRMKVNYELEELSGVLKAAGTVLKVGGRLLVISFHSLEDRTTKRFIQGKDGAGTETIFKLIGGKPLKPDQLEIDNNPRSRSAILRIAEKVI